MKRIFSILIALVLLITAVPFTAEEAFAMGLNEDKTKYYIQYDPGSGNGSVTRAEGPYDLNTAITLPTAAGCGFTYEGYYCSGWSISGKTYSEGAAYTNTGSGSIYQNQYLVTATAQWTKVGTSAPSSSSSSSSSSGSSSTSSSTTEIIVNVSYDPGQAGGFVDSYSYKGTKVQFVIAECGFTYSGYKFVGWECDVDDKIYEPGTLIKVEENASIVFTALWEKEDGSSSSSSSSASSSAASSSKPSSSSASSSKPSSSSKPASSVASSSSSSSESSSIESSESSSSVAEVIPEFKPVTLAFSIDGDIPVTKIEFVLNEDVGENPTLNILPVDNYSVTDSAATKFVADGDALAAFDLSLLVEGKAYAGSAQGSVVYHLNGTQASAVSNYESYVLAMVHTVKASKFDGDYYMTDGENTYLYDPETDFKTAVSNIKLVEEDGVYRLVIRDVSGLSSFAYMADEETIVEVNLVPNVNAGSASIDVTSLSPILLVQFEVGEGKASAGIPVWIWIVIASVVLVMAILVVLFLINRSNEQKREYIKEKRSVPAPSTSSVITGFDDEE